MVRFTVDATSPAVEAREWFRFESDNRRAVQANASIFTADRAAELRGKHPQLLPVGSPGASGPQTLVVFEGDAENYAPLDRIDLRLDAIERFRYLR